jgi:hypothetical protein
MFASKPAKHHQRHPLGVASVRSLVRTIQGDGCHPM